jgi:hypothetical protein
MYKKIPWPKSASELYRPNDRRLSAKLVTTFADRGYHVVSVTNPYGRNVDFYISVRLGSLWCILRVETYYTIINHETTSIL